MKSRKRLNRVNAKTVESEKPKPFIAGVNVDALDTEVLEHVVEEELNACELEELGDKLERWVKQIRASLSKESSAEESSEKLYAGNWICSNVYINLGLSREQSKVLTAFSKKFLRPGHRNNAQAAWFLLNAALSNIEIVETLLRADLDAERRAGSGYASGEIIWQQKARAKLNQCN